MSLDNETLMRRLLTEDLDLAQSKDLRAELDRRVLAFIQEEPKTFREVERHFGQALEEVRNTTPLRDGAHKLMRLLDQSTQRLRRAGKITSEKRFWVAAKV